MPNLEKNPPVRTMFSPLKHALFVVHGPVSLRLWWLDLRQNTAEKNITKVTHIHTTQTHTHTEQSDMVISCGYQTWKLTCSNDVQNNCSDGGVNGYNKNYGGAKERKVSDAPDE